MSPILGPLLGRLWHIIKSDKFPFLSRTYILGKRCWPWAKEGRKCLWLGSPKVALWRRVIRVPRVGPQRQGRLSIEGKEQSRLEDIWRNRIPYRRIVGA